MEPSSDDPDVVVATVVFVDLVRFTSLTDVHGDRAGADAAALLVAITEQALGDDARLVKTAGDGVLIAAAGPTAGLRCGAQIIEDIHDRYRGLDARGGADHGPLIERDGDVFGSTVNLAARLSAMAQPGALVVTRRLAEVAGDADLAVTPLGPTAVSGFTERVELFEVDPCRHDDPWLTDPVCGMRLRTDQVVDSIEHDGQRFGFCSGRCAALFRDSPDQFVDHG